jgi:hypothetical protein
MSNKTYAERLAESGKTIKKEIKMCTRKIKIDPSLRISWRKTSSIKRRKNESGSK